MTARVEQTCEQTRIQKINYITTEKYKFGTYGRDGRGGRDGFLIKEGRCNSIEGKSNEEIAESLNTIFQDAKKNAVGKDGISRPPVSVNIMGGIGDGCKCTSFALWVLGKPLKNRYVNPDEKRYVKLT